MDSRPRSQARHVAFDLAASLALEFAVGGLIRKVRGPRVAADADPDAPAKRRLVRRLLAAVLVEFAEGGIAEARWQRHRLHAAIEKAAARESLAASERRGRRRRAGLAEPVAVPDQRQPATITRNEGEAVAPGLPI